jgi:hypothetical protein
VGIAVKSGLLLLVFCFLAVSPAQAEIDAETLLLNHARGTAEAKDILAGMLGATENGLSWANTAISNEGQPRLYCVPAKLALTNAQDVDILRRYTLDHPDKKTLPYGLALLLALKEAFPCNSRR